MAEQLFLVAVYGDIAKVMKVTSGTPLRDLQEKLCRAFGKAFPTTKAVVSIDGVLYDEFSEYPFLGSSQTHVLGLVDFASTDDPYFYDLHDRCGKQGTIWEELEYERQKECGATDLTFADWLQARRTRVEMDMLIPFDDFLRRG